MAVDSSNFQPSRIGFGSILGAPRPAGRISKRRRGALVPAADMAEHRARGDPGTALERLHVDARAVEAEDVVQIAAEVLRALVRLAGAACCAGVGTVRVGEQALLQGAGRLGGAPRLGGGAGLGGTARLRLS